MTGFGEIDQNDCFGPKWANFDSFGAKMGQTGFFWKKRKCHFRTQVCARDQNKPMNGF